ncbi:TPA: hypothetical protein ACH3X1_014575 [Trebouxia sp. C0004]
MPLLHHSPRARRLCLPRCNKVSRAASQETDVISIHMVCEPQVPDLHPSSWSRGLQMPSLQPINEDAKQGGTEWAALSKPNGWTLAVATLSIDPHGQQRAIIQGLKCAQHVAVYPQAL